jgi:hypothetical protein
MGNGLFTYVCAFTFLSALTFYLCWFDSSFLRRRPPLEIRVNGINIFGVAISDLEKTDKQCGMRYAFQEINLLRR